MKTTLNKIKACNQCSPDSCKLPLTRYQLLLSTLSTNYGLDTPITITQILDSNGPEDAVWCLRTIDGYDKEMRLFAVKCINDMSCPSVDFRLKLYQETLRDYTNDLIIFTGLPDTDILQNGYCVTAAKIDYVIDYVQSCYYATKYSRDRQNKHLRELCSTCE